MTSSDLAEISKRFAMIAREFCSIIDSAPGKTRSDFLVEIYEILPKLIAGAIGLPALSLEDSDESDNAGLGIRAELSQERLHKALTQKLGDWSTYRLVFDPTKDADAIYGSLADDLADIYRELKEGLSSLGNEGGDFREITWHWRFSYYSHWGWHAVHALTATHFRLREMLE